MNKYLKWFSVLSSLVLFVGVFIVVREVRKGRDIRFPEAVSYPGKLTFSPTSISVRPGQNFDRTISVNMDTGGKTVSHADIQISFDKAKLELTGITKESHGVFKTYAPVNSSGNFDSAKVISEANSTGLIVFSILSFDWATNSKKSPFNGTFSPLTKLNFKAKSGAIGTDTISLKYISEGETTDSNLVHKPSGSDPEDILANPTSEVTVSFISPTEPPPPPACSTVAKPTLSASCSNYRNNLTCSWSRVNNATEYRVQIDNNSDFSSPVLDTTSTGTSATKTAVNANVNYYCRVRVNKSNGTCTVNNQWSTVATVKKACPTPTPTVTITPTPTNTPTHTNTPSPTDKPTNTPVVTFTPVPVEGDATGDGNVDIEDYKVWVNNYNSSTQGGSNNADFDNNGKVDGEDYVIWLRNFQ